MSTRNCFSLAAAFVFVTACGGGSSSPAVPIVPSPAPPPLPPAIEAPGGLWFGTLTFDQNMVTEEFVALSADDGRFRFVSVDSEVHFIGAGQVNGTNLSATARAFADAGVNWLDGNHVVETTITAVISERNTFSGTWANESGESGTFEFFYDTLHEKDSATALLEAVWTGYDDLGNPEITFTIDASGAFSGQNAMGCTSIGQFTVIDAEVNLYDVWSDISNCGIAGSYTGFALLADLQVANDALLVSVDDGFRTILLGLEK